jgi:hypothetical protein
MVPHLGGKIMNMGQASAYLCRKWNAAQLLEQRRRVVDAVEKWCALAKLLPGKVAQAYGAHRAYQAAG